MTLKNKTNMQFYSGHIVVNIQLPNLSFSICQSLKEQNSENEGKICKKHEKGAIHLGLTSFIKL